MSLPKHYPWWSSRHKAGTGASLTTCLLGHPHLPSVKPSNPPGRAAACPRHKQAEAWRGRVTTASPTVTTTRPGCPCVPDRGNTATKQPTPPWGPKPWEQRPGVRGAATALVRSASRNKTFHGRAVRRSQCRKPIQGVHGKMWALGITHLIWGSDTG